MCVITVFSNNWLVLQLKKKPKELIYEENKSAKRI